MYTVWIKLVSGLTTHSTVDVKLKISGSASVTPTEAQIPNIAFEKRSVKIFNIKTNRAKLHHWILSVNRDYTRWNHQLIDCLLLCENGHLTQCCHCPGTLWRTRRVWPSSSWAASRNWKSWQVLDRKKGFYQDSYYFVLNCILFITNWFFMFFIFYKMKG